MLAKTTTNKRSAPIKWHGGKTYLAKAIIDMMPEHTHYVEPYFGGGAVLFRKPVELVEGHSEVVNDLFDELVTFWRVLQSPRQFASLKRKVEATPFAKPVWEAALRCSSKDSVTQAHAFFVRFRQSRQGLGRDFATMSRTRTRRGMNEQVSSWLSAIEGLNDAHERLKRVAIFKEDACRVIEREDDESSLFYCDPPYLTQTRVVGNAYSFEMTDQQHVELLEVLGAIKGKFLLSGYRNRAYDEAAQKYGWNRTDIKIDNKASSKKTKPIKTECIWTNS